MQLDDEENNKDDNFDALEFQMEDQRLKILNEI
jgi:hypothetical protein